MGPFYLGAEAKLTLHTSVKMMSNNNNNNNSLLFSSSFCLKKAAKVLRPSGLAEPLAFVPLEGEKTVEAINRLNCWGYLMK